MKRRMMLTVWASLWVSIAVVVAIWSVQPWTAEQYVLEREQTGAWAGTETEK